MKDLCELLSSFLNDNVSLFISVALCIVIPYLLGSVNFALVISKVFYHDDIRKYGSGNAGMTNMLRTYGKLAAGGTLFCDMFKAVISVLLGHFFYSQWGVGGYMAGFFCVLGHIFPIFFKFKGGKGVATTAAMILTLDPLCFVFLLIVFVVIVASTKYVSLGSVISCMIYPVLTYKIAYAGISGWGIGFPVIFSFLTAATVVFMHRENISRLRKGTENKISFSKTSKEKK